MAIGVSTSGKRIFAVLLYPPQGVLRVVDLPDIPGFLYPLQMFKTKEEAEAALEKFLTENPDYRQWRDGKIERN
jgi:hypothetical protein